MNIRKIRLRLANWIWPHDLKVGDKFTLVRWTKTGDRSWIGGELEVVTIIGELVRFKYAIGSYNYYHHSTTLGEIEYRILEPA